MRENKLKAQIIRMDANATYERAREALKTARKFASNLRGWGINFDAELKFIDDLIFKIKDQKDKEKALRQIRDCIQRLKSFKDEPKSFENAIRALKLQVFIDDK